MVAMVRIPTIWSCKTANYGWLNLAKARKVQPGTDTKGQPCVLVTWDNGQEEFFGGKDAETIMSHWLQAVEKYIKPYHQN